MKVSCTACIVLCARLCTAACMSVRLFLVMYLGLLPRQSCLELSTGHAQACLLQRSEQTSGLQGVSCNVAKAGQVAGLANFAKQELGHVDLWCVKHLTLLNLPPPVNQDR